ncbi:MAG: general secretion pathway protein GspK [Candidatus Omnitrophica bacterium]|nr:general secretion pathway protein GspK [Candidatus Omnitrophota bacterium]
MFYKDLPGQSIFPQAARTDAGSILMIALWSLCLLASFALTLGYKARQEIFFIQKLEEREKLRLISEAGLKKAVATIKNMDWDEVLACALKDPWNNDPEAYSGVTVGQGQFDIFHNDHDEYTQTSKLRWGLVDEERKININKADMTVLRNFFKLALGLDDTGAQNLAASIVDWRDADSELSVPSGSAEDSYYRGLPYPYEAKDADFEFSEEILLVKDMNAEIFSRIKDYITIFGSGKINVNTAPEVTLLSLGLPSHVVDYILSIRSGDDREEGTEDDIVFESTSGIISTIKQFYDLSQQDVAVIQAAIEQKGLVTKSVFFMASCRARLFNRKNYQDSYCVMNNKGKILSWRIF